MNNLSEKVCPLFNKKCISNECAFFNQLLDGCEIVIMNYNLYQLKQSIRSLLTLSKDPSIQVLDTVTQNKPRYPRNID